MEQLYTKIFNLSKESDKRIYYIQQVNVLAIKNEFKQEFERVIDENFEKFLERQIGELILGFPFLDRMGKETEEKLDKYLCKCWKLFRKFRLEIF